MDLSVLLLNCRSLGPKLGEVKLMLYSKKPQLLCVSETWISKYEPRFINYNTEWRHRTDGRRGGGLGFIIRRDVQYENIELKMYKNGVLEVQAMRIKMSGRDLGILHIYNPNENLLSRELKHYMDQMGQTYLIIGDFNAKSPLLESECRKRNETGRTLENILETEELCLINPIDFYTYCCPATGKRSCLDLCLATANITAETSIKEYTDVGSDHRTIHICVNLQPKLKEIVPIRKWKVTKEALEQFKINLKKSEIICPNDIETLNNDIKRRINESAEKTIGHTTGRCTTRKRTCWWNATCSKAVAERRCARRKMEKHPTLANIRMYQKKTQECKKICNDQKRESFNQFISTLTYDTPATNIWRKINSLKSQYKPQSFPLTENGKLIENAIEKANMFVKSYIENSNINKVDNGKYQILIDKCCSENEEEQNKDITREELETALRMAKNTTPGEDGIPCSLLKKLDGETKENLLQIYNQSFHTGMIPQSWKIGIVIPILKPEKPKDCLDSYRPITLLNTTGKILERIIQRRMEFKLETEKLLSGYQSGFRKNQGTNTILIRLENKIKSCLDKGEICVVVYFDLKSAFDRVWPTGILYKLGMMGFKGDILKWLRNYFRDRKIRVRIDGQYSEECGINAGVPQGAVLSPLLFNVMMSDMPEVEDVKLFVYADDIAVCSSAKNVQEVKRRVEDYIKKFIKWTDEWGITINTGKTSMQYFTRKRMGYPIIRLQNMPIKYLKEKKLLGIILDSPSLTFRAHINKLSTECTRRINMMVISSTRWGACSKILRLFCLAYIRSKIDYGAMIYGGASEVYTGKLEVIQNSCLRLILGARKSSPVISLQVEAQIPPLTLQRGYLAAKEYVKLLYSSENNYCSKELKLVTGMTHFKAPASPFNSFYRRGEAFLNMIDIPHIKRINTNLVSQVPPWMNMKEFFNSGEEIEVIFERKEEYQDYIEENFKSYNKVYCDGSKILDGEKSTASGMYVEAEEKVICWKMRPEHTVMCAELFAIYQALRYIENEEVATGTIIFTDSRSSIQLLIGTDRKYLNIAEKIRVLLLKVNVTRRVIVHWIKAHIGIRGNEIADKAAKMGHRQDKMVWLNLEKEELLNTLKQKYINYWNTYWKETVSFTGKGKHLENIRESVQSIYNPKFKERRKEIVMNRLRIGHAGVKQYLFRFNMSQEETCDDCHVPETIEHLLMNCKKYKEERCRLKQTLNKYGITDIGLKVLLGDNMKNKRNKIILNATAYCNIHYN